MIKTKGSEDAQVYKVKVKTIATKQSSKTKYVNQLKSLWYKVIKTEGSEDDVILKDFVE